MITETKLERDVRLLKLYAAVVSIALALLLVTGFVSDKKNQKFEEIDVERINLVEKDGRLRMVIANGARQHPGTVDGKPIPRKEPRPAGMIFFSERGDEVGGLVFSGEDGKGQFGSLTFDKFRGDQTIAFQHLEGSNGAYFSGISFNDENITTPERSAKVEAINKLATEAERKAAFGAMRDKGEFLVNRLVVGKGRDKSSLISMSDAKGKERLSISVTADGTPKINFYDEKGKVTYTLPEDRKKD